MEKLSFLCNDVCKLNFHKKLHRKVYVEHAVCTFEFALKNSSVNCGFKRRQIIYFKIKIGYRPIFKPF